MGKLKFKNAQLKIKIGAGTGQFSVDKNFPQNKVRKMKPTLFIFSGLPGSGKTTLSKRLAKSKKAVYLRIDTVEQALRDFSLDVQGEGYGLCYRIAFDNLELGSVWWPIPVTRLN
jgi:hypothetical protein